MFEASSTSNFFTNSPIVNFNCVPKYYEIEPEKTRNKLWNSNSTNISKFKEQNHINAWLLYDDDSNLYNVLK